MSHNWQDITEFVREYGQLPDSLHQIETPPKTPGTFGKQETVRHYDFNLDAVNNEHEIKDDNHPKADAFYCVFVSRTPVVSCRMMGMCLRPDIMESLIKKAKDKKGPA